MRLSRPTPLLLSSCLAAITWAAGSAAHAQSLQELYDAARVYDASYLASRALADSAQYRVAQTEALMKPGASLTSSAGRSDNDAAPAGLSAGATVAASVPLFNRANRVTIEQARRTLDISLADLDSAEQDLIVRVAVAYFDVLAAQDALNTTRANKTFITEQLASARRNFEVGTATITDTREAQARFDLATAQEIAAENDLRTKRIALDQLVGRSGVEPKGLVVPVVLPPPQPADSEAWVGAADATHPGVRRARVAYEIAQLETAKARANELPTVAASASVSHSQAGRTFGSLNGLTSNAVGVTLNWPLYTGGATQNRIKETLALEERSRNDVETARRGVALATRQAFFGVQSGLAQVRALEAAEASTKLALEATQLGYRVGVRVNLDVLNAQTQLFQTQRDLARARYDVVVGGLRLRQASGQLKPADLQPVNALLAR